MYRPRLLLLAAVFLAPVVNADDHILKSIEIFDLEVASETQISPDGSQIAYVRRAMDIMTDRARNNIWIIDADGDNHRPIVSGADSYSSPRWSPSGDRIAYVTAAEGRGAEIHVRWMDTGQSAMLTNVAESPSSISWSPDGNHIAFTMFVPADGMSLATAPKKPEGAQWADPVKVIDRLYYRADGRGIGRAHV